MQRGREEGGERVGRWKRGMRERERGWVGGRGREGGRGKGKEGEGGKM